MSAQYKVIVVTADAENARLINEHFSATENVVTEVISKDQLKESIQNITNAPYHAVILSDALDGEWDKQKELLAGGKNIPVLKLLEPEKHNSDSSVDGMIENLETRVSELVERLSLTNALQQRDGDMRRIIDKSADSILIFDQDGIVLFLNPAAQEFFGKKLELGMEFGYPVVSGETTEIDLISCAGERLVAEMRVTPIEWSGKSACLAILRDITERKLTEEMLEQKVEARTAALEAATTQLLQMYRVSEQAVQLRSQFIANVSHEIRTPLAGILSGAELLCLSPDAENAAELGPIIFGSAQNLLQLVNEILDFAKIERGEFSLNETTFCIRELVHDIVRQMHSFAEQKQLSLLANFSSRLEPSYYGDVGKIRQILLNLVHNALKFTNDGGVMIHVKPYEERFVQLVISDTGLGIDQKDQSLIFQPFVQGNDPQCKKPGGTGLGLSICSQLAKALNGSITCQSKYGEGSTFTLKLPLKGAGKS